MRSSALSNDIETKQHRALPVNVLQYESLIDVRASTVFNTKHPVLIFECVTNMPLCDTAGPALCLLLMPSN